MSKNSSLNRRNFIKSAAAGAAGLAVLGTGHLNAETTEKVNDRKFIYRTLGKTGIKVPVISMGVMNADNPKLVRAALEAGILHLDTAWYYQRGNNEKMIGEVVKDFPRDSYTIATKIGADKNRDTRLYDEGTTEKRFTDEFETSMSRLKLDYVDILYLHNNVFKGSILYEPAMSAFEKIRKSGRARFLGVTTHYNEPEIINAAAESGFWEVIETAYNFRKDNLKELNAAIQKAVNAGLGIVAMKNLAGGFWNKERTEPINATAAIKWALQNPNIHTCIPGMTQFDHLEDDLKVMEDLALSDLEKKDLRMDTETGSLYCPGCGNCLKQCKQNLPVPDIMRAYMYTYGYKNLNEAHTLMSNLDIPKNICDDCSECTVQCTTGFDVPGKIKDVSRIIGVPKDFFV